MVLTQLGGAWARPPQALPICETANGEVRWHKIWNRGFTLLKEDIKNGLRELGLKAGDVVMVHSSLSSMGYVVGGADTVIDALLEVVGEEGTIVMPTYTFMEPWEFFSYDPEETPSKTGRITEVFRHRPGVLRSRRPPRWPFAAVGPHAEEIIRCREIPSRDLENDEFYRMGQLGGFVLLLGVPQMNNTAIHHAEEHAACQGFGYIEVAIGYWKKDFNKLDRPLLEAGVMRATKIGEAEVRLIELKGLFEVVNKVLQKDLLFLLADEELKPKGPGEIPDSGKVEEEVTS